MVARKKGSTGAKAAPTGGRLVTHADDFKSLLTGIGTVTRDKRLSYTYERTELSHDTAEAMVESSDMAARIVETPPEEMCREGFTVRIEQKKKWEEATNAQLEDLDLLGKLQAAVTDARTYGGSAILVGALDGVKDLGEPLNLDRIQTVSWLTGLTARELKPVDWFRSATAARYGEPSMWEVLEERYSSRDIALVTGRDNQRIHDSRLIKFHGVRLSRRRTREVNGWGGSVLARCYQVLQDFQTSWSGAALLLQDFSQAILKLKGMTETMEAGKESVLVRRAAMLNMSRSIANILLLDEEDEFERVATPMGGMPEMLQQFALRLAAAARMPVSLLMGQAPAGLNATGASDIRFWYDYIAAQQRKVLEPAVTAFLQVLFRSKDGPTRGREPDNWRIEWHPLWQLTEMEQADLRGKVAQSDAAYVNAGVVTPEEVAISRFGGERWSMETRLDEDARAALAAQEEVAPEATPEVPPGTEPAPAEAVP